MTDVNRLVQMASENGDFVTGDDGFVFFWPKGCNGGLSEWMLRALADEIERRNAPWAAQLEQYWRDLETPKEQPHD